jgi:hypothetical protein
MVGRQERADNQRQSFRVVYTLKSRIESGDKELFPLVNAFVRLPSDHFQPYQSFFL